LARMVGNLLTNARRHAVEQVRVQLVESDGEVVLTVDDDGTGVAPADRERVYERFVRLDEARSTHDGGSGLGLAIAREIVVAHGGAIEMGTSPLGGARVTVHLPGSR
ncbi:MAG TPA: ATP-binding protein, partial [Ilumatobacteraceae bacterium]|nr:ATP-binding protein [Ilumatobacteraceae bacterium]